MTTLVDVARKAGVSKSTVSNVVRGVELVSPMTRERVEMAIAQTGYRPNAIARALKARSTTALAIVVPDLCNPFHAELTVAAEREANRRGYALLAANTECKAELEHEAGRALIARQVDGVIIGGMSLGSQLPKMLLDRGIPVTLASLGDHRDPRLSIVDTDDRGGMNAIIAHLFGMGHRKMAFVSQGLLEHAGQRRRLAFSRALRRLGLRPARSWQVATAIVAHNDVHAIATIDQLESRGIRVPEDMSVVGFDDIPLARHRRIGLTTIRSDATAIGARAVEFVVRAAQAGDLTPSRDMFATSLVVRSSTGSAKA